MAPAYGHRRPGCSRGVHYPRGVAAAGSRSYCARGFCGLPVTRGGAVSTGNWVRTHESATTRIESLDGIEWGNGDPPRRWHRCRPQTRGWIGPDYTERCNCGAARMDPSGLWIHRNETRTARKKQQREDALPRVTVTC